MQEYFAYRGSKELLDLIDRAGQRAGVGRSRAFSDWLEMCICALSGGRMEDRYLEIVNPYGGGERTAKGKLYDDSRRAIDDLADAFGCLGRHTEETRRDIIGDAFRGGNLNDAGQFFTPDNVCELMARMINHDEKIVGKRFADPCCGSGRMLLAAARLNPNNFFCGQDTDLRCVRMTAINLAHWGLRGEVLWGNSLTLEARGGYRTGFNGRGFIRELASDELPMTPPPSPPAEPKMPTLFDDAA